MATHSRVLRLLAAMMILEGLPLAQQTPAHESLDDALRAAVGLAGEGKFSAAANLLNPAVRAAGRSAPAPQLAVALTYLGGLYMTEGLYSESVQSFRRAVSLWETQRVPNVEWHMQAVRGLALAYLEQGRSALSEKLLTRYLPVWRGGGADSPEVARLLHTLGEAYENRRRYAEATALYEESRGILSNRTGQDERMAELLTSLGRTQLKMRYCAKAHASLDGALAIHARLYTRSHPTTVGPLLIMSYLHRSTGELSEAERWIRITLETAFGTAGLEHPLAGIALLEHAALLRALGRKTEAKKTEEQARAILRRFPNQSPSRYTVDVTELMAEQARR
jgi:tetratricopeptide (TPR) repeat protein